MIYILILILIICGIIAGILGFNIECKKAEIEMDEYTREHELFD